MEMTEKGKRHEAEVSAAVRVWGNVFEKTTIGGADAPLVLRFERPDSKFRYAVFCVSTVMQACAPRMSSPDAILNELLHDLVILGQTNPDIFGSPPGTPQQLMNDAANHGHDYLQRWSAYVDIVEGGNPRAAASLLGGTLRSIESNEPASDTDAHRLQPLVTWIERNLAPMGSAFDRLKEVV